LKGHYELQTIGIVDLFAGPGGLGEGFSSLQTDAGVPFKIGISIEKDISAHATLTLRAFLREYRARHGRLPPEFIDYHAREIDLPNWEAIDPEIWGHAQDEALALELGSAEAGSIIDSAIGDLQKRFKETVLIGGPPCQAYSLVGRARSRGKAGYVPEEDERHFLFREYIRVLRKLRPAAFVMENVKGMLSSTVESRLVFEMLMEDLSSLGGENGHLYELRAIRTYNGKAVLCEPTQPSDFIVRAEHFGVPQRRHRVIIIGIRSDLARSPVEASIDNSKRSVDQVIGNLPHLRSGISRQVDRFNDWQAILTHGAEKLAHVHQELNDVPLRITFEACSEELRVATALQRTSNSLPNRYAKSNDLLLQWLETGELAAIAQHETRAHMASDLERYLFASVFAQVHGHSPKADAFPDQLVPAHRNWRSGAFNDRFRVQLAEKPSTTITSHISKDGHYFIHPDPLQCRSLTVREAARLQTFPDDYLFMGNRTQQYVQVGNAVPPYLARQIAQLVHEAISPATRNNAQGSSAPPIVA
jgi:DNA (cytosine-5)-methyltransferase 1